MTLTLLFIAIGLVSITQPNIQRLFAAFVFIAITFSHELFFSQLEGLPYHSSAALFSLLIIVCTSGIYPVPKMVLRLHAICMVSIAANAIGFMLWLAYLPPLIYDFSFILIYIWALLTLIARDGSDVGHFTTNSWSSCFRFNRAARVSNYTKDQSTVRS